MDFFFGRTTYALCVSFVCLCKPLLSWSHKQEREQVHTTKYKDTNSTPSHKHTRWSRPDHVIWSIRCVFGWLCDRTSKNKKRSELIITPALIFIFWLNSNSLRFCFPTFIFSESFFIVLVFLYFVVAFSSPFGFFLSNFVLLTMQLKPHVHTTYYTYEPARNQFMDRTKEREHTFRRCDESKIIISKFMHLHFTNLFMYV